MSTMQIQRLHTDTSAPHIRSGPMPESKIVKRGRPLGALTLHIQNLQPGEWFYYDDVVPNGTNKMKTKRGHCWTIFSRLGMKGGGTFIGTDGRLVVYRKGGAA